MFGTSLIVFREVLEAALIVGIVAAATRDIPGRGRFIWGGLALGIVGSCVVAAMAEGISALAQGVGDILGMLILPRAFLPWRAIGC